MIGIIMQRFEQEKESRTYRRINSTHPISIYLGFNQKGNKSMVVTEMGGNIILNSTQLIETQLSKRSDGKLSVEFALLDDRFSSMFYKFCEDIIISSVSINKEQAIGFVANRWNAWRLMFKNGSNDKLSDSGIQGLIGELIFIEKVMIPKYGVERGISSWDGPLGNPKDFTIDGTWYEVKTTTPGNSIIKISSLEQLDSDKEGNLEVVRVEKTNIENDNAINLNMQVEKIKSKIIDIRILKEYMKRLSEIHYCYDEYYNSVYFEYKAIEEYKVDDRFPRIKRGNLSNAILKVQYDINIAELGGC